MISSCPAPRDGTRMRLRDNADIVFAPSPLGGLGLARLRRLACAPRSGRAGGCSPGADSAVARPFADSMAAVRHRTTSAACFIPLWASALPCVRTVFRRQRTCTMCTAQDSDAATSRNVANARAVFDRLLRQYERRTPQMAQVRSRLVDESGRALPLENDHVAFRTLGTAPLGISSIERVLESLGYTRRDGLSFEQKKLDAFWYSAPESADTLYDPLPRVFVSELRFHELTNDAQRIIHEYVAQVDDRYKPGGALFAPQSVDEMVEFFGGDEQTPVLPWPAVTRAHYDRLSSESEYAGWVLTQGNQLNHFTVSVHSLPDHLDTCEKISDALSDVSQGAALVFNRSGGGIVKVSPDGLLRQCATMAAEVPFRFADEADECLIPGAYVEFAERLALPAYKDLRKCDLKRHMRRDGFESANADRIFESTSSAASQ
ncbi:hypothetical protein FVE85_1002 [Porphyridium purpureum]|uniref:2-oxoadipate dioxygenase/decarboxylase n=1 Tax=Porphyridium purpureum TaxID=35688 RepID=A0A5J4Z2W2_PORPP|nr:hypothetical protein FVE85_1002 [Porphyridium purpureum]|eukprot:POR5802..scf208_2